MRILGIEIGKRNRLQQLSNVSLSDKSFEDIGNFSPKPEVSATDSFKSKDTDGIQDIIPEIGISVPDSKKPTNIPQVVDPVLKYSDSRTTGRGEFVNSEYNLAEVGRIIDTDGIPNQAFIKKTALMFKEGWEVTGHNPKVTNYIRIRLAQIARASSKSTDQLLREIGSSLISKSNAFVIKVRNTRASGGRVRTVPGKKKQLKPVAAYFVAPAETMQARVSNGKITKWRQCMPDGTLKEYNVEDVVHIYYNKKDGFIMGTPTIVPVVDDIRALRKIEENIELLIYQYLFPLFQWKVGTAEAPATITEDGHKEVDIVRAEIRNMPSEGGIVTTERHEIRAIGSEGRALRAESYLDHFKRRVVSGLGISMIDIGESDTVNRSTADNLSRSLVDSVKDYQLVLESFVNSEMISELAQESTFGSDVLNEENVPRLEFKEIDLDAQIKKENHNADLFAKDALTFSEMRQAIGRDPILIPTSDEIESGTASSENYPEWFNTRWKLFQEPTLLMQSLDEAWTPLSKAAARAATLGVTSADVDESRKAQQEAQANKTQGAVRAKVATQAKTRAKNVSTRRVKDSFLQQRFIETEKEISGYISDNPLDKDWITSLVTASISPAIDRLVIEQSSSFKQGYSSVSFYNSNLFMNHANTARNLFRRRAEKYVNKIIKDVNRSLKKNLSKKMEPSELLNTSRDIFRSLRYRTKFIEDVEIGKAFTFGQMKALKDTNIKFIVIKDHNESCDSCSNHSGIVINLEGVTIEDLPPLHPKCDCGISSVLISENDSYINNDIQDDLYSTYVNRLSEYKVSSCEKCGEAAGKVKYTLDLYFCSSCNHSQKIKDIEFSDRRSRKPAGSRSGSGLRQDCIRNVKRELLRSMPSVSRSHLAALARQICIERESDDSKRFRVNKTKAVFNSETIENLTDADKMERCVLKVKKSLRKKHPDWGSDKIKTAAFAICNSRLKGDKDEE